MLDSLFSTSTATASTATSVELLPLLVCTLCALVLGAVLAAVYSYRQRHTRSFTIALVVIPAIVCVVIAMVNGNLGAGVAVAGAFSLVRFRSAPGSGRDIAYVFLAMAVGLVAGMGYLAAAAMVTVVIGGACLALQQFTGRSRTHARDLSLRITVPEDLDYSGAFDDVLARYTTYHELASVRTCNMGSLFRLTYDVGMEAGTSEKAMIDELRARNGNLEVSLSHQEVSGYGL
ncbi:DUF4956 domain-containing protein [Olsenella sp. Marseille-P4559]|jgi:hypothetical protein|uniref:DUF4956 domain-containing protein n=1 Tax=Olsenella sp. Marseille-P4559 TaxID=2364795 RepID=UPI001032353C|nr:DUF4956 domain-containing protein [Olsenella sp. Marseille-P4559]